jgi:hypothetical protein
MVFGAQRPLVGALVQDSVFNSIESFNNKEQSSTVGIEPDSVRLSYLDGEISCSKPDFGLESPRDSSY